MPRPDSAESTRAIWGVLATHLENAPGDSLRPLLTAGTTVGLLGLLAGTSSGRAARGSVFPRKVTCHPATPDSYARAGAPIAAASPLWVSRGPCSYRDRPRPAVPS